MSEPFHIMIGSEQGTLRTFTFSSKTVKIIACSALGITLTIGTTGFFTAGYFIHNRLLSEKVDKMALELQDSQKINKGMSHKLAVIERQSKEKIAALTLKNNLLISNLKIQNSHKIAELEEKNLKQVTTLKKEKEHLLSTAVTELNERNALIEDVMKDIGIKIKKTDSEKNSGGPYIPLEDKNYGELLDRTDKYLKTIRHLPLGRPVPGDITSRYGKRVDPIKKKKAFHSGIDFRGKFGTKIRATADGKVVFAGRNGSYGNFVKIDHGNGFYSSFAHMQRYLVKKGAKVVRGQTVGLVGSSGRSTGPHLHYEIKHKGKTVNPYKFMKF
jgi:murein DD-endopeptidase MepM/ murein hydrolase activator NlpD